MKKRLPIAVGSLIFLLTGVIFLLHSCKKQDRSTSGQDTDLHAAELSAIATRIAREGITYTVQVNQRLEAYYVDSANNRIPTEVLQKTKESASVKGIASIVSACDYSNIPQVMMISYAITTNCQQGFSVTWTYQVSTNNNIVLASPQIPTAITKGFLRIFNSSNTLVSSSTAAAGGLQDQGPDKTNPGYELYGITFTASNIAASYFVSGNSMDLGATLMTNCPDVEAFPIAISYYDLNGSGGADANPCDRIDQVQIPSITYTPFHIYGEDPLGDCSSGFTFPDLQEVEYAITSANGVPNWVSGEAYNTSSTFSYVGGILNPIYSPFQNFAGGGYGYVDPFGFLELQINLPPGIYSLQIRYRNIKFNSPLVAGQNWPVPVFTGANANCCAGSWSEPTTYVVTYSTTN
jgi:hypothetical protein